MLGHGLHFDMVLSKLRINVSLTCDFAYLTKNTGQWYIVLVELEKPTKPIFCRDKRQVVFHSDFTRAVGQIESWRTQLTRDDAEIRRQLDPLFIHMANNPIEYKFILIYGRDSEVEQSRTRRQRFSDKSGTDLRVLTYDSLERRVCGLHGQSFSSVPKNIFTLSRQQFCLKYLHDVESGIWGWMSNDHISVTPEQEKRLIDAGVEMHEWKKGNLLRYATVGYRGTSLEKMSRVCASRLSRSRNA